MPPIPPLRAVAVALMLTSFATLANAQERTEESFIPHFAVASAYYSWSADADFGDGPGSMGQQEAGVGADYPLLQRDGVLLTAGLMYRWNELEFSGAPAPLGSHSFDLHRLEIPFNVWADLGDRWKLWVRLQPGVYSDFEHVNSDDFTLTTLALVSYRWSEWLKVAFGAFYSHDFGEERILPALGFLIEPNRNWSLALAFPRIELAYAPTPDWLFSGRAVLSGAGWNIANPAGFGEDIDLNYQAIRVGVGVDRRIAGGPWWVYVDAGMQVGQELEIEGGGYDYSAELDPSAFVASGVRLRF